MLINKTKLVIDGLMILEEMEMIGRNRKCFREGVAKIENGAWRIKGKIVNGFGRGVIDEFDVDKEKLRSHSEKRVGPIGASVAVSVQSFLVHSFFQFFPYKKNMEKGDEDDYVGD
jgi:hypothetical protein